MTAVSPGLSRWHPAYLIATFGHVGRLPFAPGTWGSLAALPTGWVVQAAAGRAGLLLAAGLLFLLGCWAAGLYIRRMGVQDPPPVVVDEVAAQWLVLSVVPASLPAYCLGFLLFRIFDVLKPWPVDLADRRLQGGFGAMFDDLLAGCYAAGALALALAIA